MSYEDKTLTCVDCSQEFVHSGEDQARYAERGFTNEPKRCRECREKRKS
ncbi:MAG: zinc-ribbon domain-containing protein, partial [Planctomycetota bacterium]|nr:zinc-ribbon domain-containing protein [Planctomycetota bacterium]